MAASNLLSTGGSWRTAFLTLRDETLTSPPTLNVLHLIIFSQSDALIASLPQLPPHEIWSDIVFLMEVITMIVSNSEDENDSEVFDTFVQVSHMIQNVCLHVSFETALSLWDVVIDGYEKLANIVLKNFVTNNGILGNAHVDLTLEHCLKVLRCFSTLYQRTIALAENPILLNFLLNIVSHFQHGLINATHPSVDRRFECGNAASIVDSVWEVQTTVFTIISEIYLKVGSYLTVNHWLSAVVVLRKIMDVLAAKGLLVEQNTLAKFYTSLLNCLHLILTDPKGPLSDHVAGFVAALKMFFSYGLNYKPQPILSVASEKKEDNNKNHNKNVTSSGAYRPPHMRKLKSNQHQECYSLEHMSSDSEYSDGDITPSEAFKMNSSKARVAAIVCLQDLCRADPKSITAQWTMVFPTSDVLQLRKCDANLMTCLIYDPHIKARLACASTLAAMLDAPVSVFLQMAEYRESTKSESFMSFSSSLGQILIQLHTGILYVIKREKHSRLVASLFKVLVPLISSTPYSRLPAELLSTTIISLKATIEEGSLFWRDNSGLLAVAINSLTVTLSVSPSSSKVNDLFLTELSTWNSDNQGRSGVLSIIFRYSDPEISPVISFEALQALRAVAHNYPNIMVKCWDQISSIVSRILSQASLAKNNVGHSAVAAIDEKITAAAVKVLDECLRAIAGFKGMEDISDDKILDSPFTSDCVKTKTVSSAPLYGLGSQVATTKEPQMLSAGSMQWCISIDSHMPIVLLHISPMVRTAAVTCFAGITSSVFLSLPKEKQDFILSSSINAALNDEVASVRSAACRAIGVIACFSHISQSAEIIGKFIYATEINTRSPLVAVRIAAAWAIANICDSVRHSLGADTSTSSVDAKWGFELIPSLIDCAMRMTTDNDKIKANAVRALGNLSRIVHLTSQSQSGACDGGVYKASLSLVANRHNKHLSTGTLQQQCPVDYSYLLERMVHSFISCVTSGNVKVQWNVCHALSNLFQNETLKLRDMDWASSVYNILLSLLRNSSNFKIKIQAVAALAVPASVLDYRSSFIDVVQSVEEMLENLNSQQISTPSSFKYRMALQKQLTSTMLHLLGLASATDYQPVHDFCVKKASFLEEWLRELCLSLRETSTTEDEHNSTETQKKEVIRIAIKSLVGIFEGRNYHSVAQRFDKLRSTL